MTTLNHYTVLGLAKSATPQDIKKAYRKLSIEFHPDFNPGDEQAAAKFRQVTEAYEVLSNPKRRKVYDNKSGLQLLRGVNAAVQEFWAQTFHVN